MSDRAFFERTDDPFLDAIMDAEAAAQERAAAAADLEAEARAEHLEALSNAERVWIGGAAAAVRRVGPGGYGSNMRVTVDYNAVGNRPPASDVRQLGEPDLAGILGLAGIIQNHIPGSRMDAEARAVELLDDARESITGFAEMSFPAKGRRAGGTIAVVLSQSERSG